MTTVLIKPEILAQRLESEARRIDKSADGWEQADPPNPGMVRELKRQAAECREWAAALRSARMLGWHGNDIEVTT